MYIDTYSGESNNLVGTELEGDVSNLAGDPLVGGEIKSIAYVVLLC